MVNLQRGRIQGYYLFPSKSYYNYHDHVMITQGDFLVHFMDIARDELAKKPDEVSVEKLQVYNILSIVPYNFFS